MELEAAKQRIDQEKAEEQQRKISAQYQEMMKEFGKHDPGKIAFGSARAAGKSEMQNVWKVWHDETTQEREMITQEEFERRYQGKFEPDRTAPPPKRKTLEISMADIMQNYNPAHPDLPTGSAAIDQFDKHQKSYLLSQMVECGAVTMNDFQKYLMGDSILHTSFDHLENKILATLEDK